MSAIDLYQLLPPFTPDSRFYPASREWHVSPRLFALIQEFCKNDPQWVEREILSYTGAGEVKIVMVIG